MSSRLKAFGDDVEIEFTCIEGTISGREKSKTSDENGGSGWSLNKKYKTFVSKSEYQILTGEKIGKRFILWPSDGSNGVFNDWASITCDWRDLI